MSSSYVYGNRFYQSVSITTRVPSWISDTVFATSVASHRERMHCFCTRGVFPAVLRIRSLQKHTCLEEAHKIFLGSMDQKEQGKQAHVE